MKSEKLAVGLFAPVLICLIGGCGLLHSTDQAPVQPTTPTPATTDLARRLADATLPPSQGGHYAISETTRSSDGWMFLMRRTPQDALGTEVMIVVHDNGKAEVLPGK